MPTYTVTLATDDKPIPDHIPAHQVLAAQNVPDHLLEEYMVRIDGKWWGGYTFPFRAAAQLVADRLIALQAYGLDALPSHLTRADYEAQCEILHLECLTDDDCTSYAVRFGEFDVLYNNAAEIAKFGLARRRYNAIHAEEEAAKKARPRAKPDLVQADCGHLVERVNLMSTSTGTSCPDCYDRMSQ